MKTKSDLGSKPTGVSTLACALLTIATLASLVGCGGGSNGFAVAKSGSLQYVAQSAEDEPGSDDLESYREITLGLDADDVSAEWDDKADGKSWTKITIRGLERFGVALLTGESIADAETYCPRYKRLDLQERGKFWVRLISAMAMKESSFKEGLNYTESFNDTTNTRVVSRGLLQISRESAKAYGCKIDEGTDLLQAEYNLPCGIKILNRWLARDSQIGSGKVNAWRGGARYWSVLRGGASKAAIVKSVSELSFCARRD